MIRINLLRNRSLASGGDTTYAISLDKGPQTEAQKEAVIKILLMSVFAIILVVIEHNIIDGLKKEHIVLSSQLEESKAKVAQLKLEADKQSEYEKEAKELDDKMKIIKTLSKTRLKELKALDFLQSIIPERVWLSSLEYHNDKFSLKGHAMTDDDLTDFIQSLDKSSFFNEVILLQAKEQTGKEGTLKVFEITASIEGQE